MTEPQGPGYPAPTLQQLLRARMEEHGWSYTDLERRSDRALSRGRWQQLGAGASQRRFPDPASLVVIAQVLEVDVTTVVLAAARSVGLDARTRDSELSRLLPAGTEQLSDRTRDAILATIRAAVADAAERSPAPQHDHLRGLALEWPKAAAPSRQGPDGPAQHERA
ncbi:hypothetical protein [Pseudonocardia xishanensis]|uniref:Helix-turn-helix protein n=1 Tax=Pseudonocardia xishanensis TaxID=630995 RepID=A0ABP8RUV9_9PSEU